jgi:single-strand DNA-binding protein
LSANFNNVVLAGRLTRDPEIRYIQNGNAVTSFAIAVNRKTKAGESAMFVDIVAWDQSNYKLAEICNTYLRKGMNVLVQGRLDIRPYETKDGDKRKSTEVVISTMQMLDKKDGASNGHAVPAGVGAAASADEDFDDSIPF